MTQYARPNGLDNNDGNWTPGAAPGETPKANLWDGINEMTLNTNYFDEVYDEESAGSELNLTVELFAVTDPVSSAEHEVHFTVLGDQGEGSLDVTLLSGSTTIVTSGIAQLDTDWESRGFLLTSSQANNIGNYSDLKLKFSYLDENIFGEVCQLSQAYFQCPDVAAPAAAANGKAFMLFLDT